MNVSEQGFKVAVVIGHDKKEQGAFSEILKLSEYSYNSKVARSSALCEFDIYERPVFGGYTAKMTKLSEEVNRKNYDLVIELHFNKFDNEANNEGEGVEVLYFPDNAYSKKLGEKFCKLVSEKYKTKNRGAKEGVRNGRGWSFLEKMNAPAMILEPFFGDEYEAEKFKDPELYAELVKSWLCG